ncbi:hypothetical protein I3843_01G203700 [Carya illinoinensis]|nr:hypothetical protein I3843_01G203700 [Carya illinoinensis]
MDSISSFKGYGKVDELEEQAFRKRTRRRLIILVISSVVLLTVIIGAVAGTLIHKRNSSPSTNSAPATELTPSASLKAVCSVTQYPDSCYSSISSMDSTNTTDPEVLFKLSLHVAIKELSKLANELPPKLNASTNDVRVNEALAVCQSVLEDAVDYLNDSISSMEVGRGDKLLSTAKINDMKTRMLGFGGEFPDWVSPGDRRLLEEGNRTVNLTVAQDGSGDFKTILARWMRLPKKSGREICDICEGRKILGERDIGQEQVECDDVWGWQDEDHCLRSLNFVDGTPTFATATFETWGSLTLAGAEKHQAVAFRSGSDRSVFYRCSFDAFQDTLYAHSNRQFYRDCDITGTIDFIFGNAAVVFQSCSIQPRQPLPNQFNTITAQGKKDPNQNSGISIQKCSFTPLDNLTAPTYLVSIASFLNPLGWMSWVPNVEPPSTIFYAEYQNSGPGSIVDKRVKWIGYKPTLTSDEAGKFTVDSLIQGSDWLPETDVSYDASF